MGFFGESKAEKAARESREAAEKAAFNAREEAAYQELKNHISQRDEAIVGVVKAGWDLLQEIAKKK